MKSEGYIEAPAVVAGGLAFLTFAALSMILGYVCEDSLSTNSVFQPITTAAVASVGIFFIFFLIFHMLDRQKIHPELFQIYRIGAALCLGIIVTWISYIAIDDNICSNAAWKKYGVLLTTPIILIGLSVFGWKWFRSDD